MDNGTPAATLESAANVVIKAETVGLSEVARVTSCVNGMMRVARFSGEDAMTEAEAYAAWRFGGSPIQRL